MKPKPIKTAEQRARELYQMVYQKEQSLGLLPFPKRDLINWIGWLCLARYVLALEKKVKKTK